MYQVSDHPKLLSVNIGEPRRNPWKTTALTGIDKQPVDGPVTVTAPGTGEVGLAGDRVYNTKHHGGPDQAVYAYAREDLAAWEADLNMPLRNGGFGENLTTQGLEVNDALIGERWLVGQREWPKSDSTKNRDTSPTGDGPRRTPSPSSTQTVLKPTPRDPSTLHTACGGRSPSRTPHAQ
ncbi:MOSC domain-containing protein [Actinomadura sp. 3N407]|uniref:MOSC domain-containing protein n=1 Tax=Actinomadura sp. 3N407 TaxID=3457423 RepID=UPI003FCE10ED